MKAFSGITGLLLAVCLTQYSWAQSTTGGRSGGSTASTGTGYLTEGKRAATSSAQSMTIADEGASRAYMYVPPTAAKPKNRSASPDGSASSTTGPSASQPAGGKKTSRKPNLHP